MPWAISKPTNGTSARAPVFCARWRRPVEASASTTALSAERATMIAADGEQIVAIEGLRQLVTDKMTEQCLANCVGNARVEQGDAQRLALA